jgi:menaquinone-dependent protoporphyrinogen oxidase
MAKTILVAYGTKHGSTREVADVVADVLRKCGLDAETRPAAQADDVSRYAGVVLGGAVYAGRWHPDAVGFLEQHRRSLARLPVAAFAMGPRTMAAEEVAATRANLLKALAKVPEVEPQALAVFGGVIDPRVLHFPFNRIPASDARDWTAIRSWAAEAGETFAFGKAAEAAGDHRRELQQTPR